jgi:hypothetical protein
MNMQAVKAGDATFSDVLAGYDTDIGALRGDVSGLGTSVGTLTTNLSQVAALAGTTSSRVTTLNQAFASPSGQGFAKALTTVDVSGRLAGWSGTSDGREGVFHIIADRFMVSDPDAPDGAIAPFSVVNGVVRATNFEADTITYGALVQRFVDAGLQNLDPAGGHQVLPGGFILQWGRYRQTIRYEQQFSILFSRPFPAACFVVVPVARIAGPTNAADLWLQNVGDPSTNGASFFAQAARSADQVLDGFDWIAFGK